MEAAQDQKNILLTVSYDGTNFCGWQKQTKEGNETFRTVQGELEKALAKIHKHPIETNGSGRTDSGVHAARQAVNFFSDIKSMRAANFLPALNSILPKDIRIMEAAEVSSLLHARFNALSRTYRYRIKCGKTVFAHEQPYVWHIRRYPDIAILNEMASCLSGELDCTAFSAAGDQSISKSRYIKKAVFFMENDYLIFEISANAFLWKMVRSIVGTLLHLEETGAGKKEFKAVLESKKREKAGPTAPPQGLFLWSIEYPADLLKAGID
ncbi:MULTISPECIES: tRNA pseudouridine(38-40) synthase TruA [unclassified Treponema]|uniref:tRNA pseudouridine(38-40) synthase TruA n=1 Tax=unclassified Treponema TaxID=2638727 RepID=UPI0020A45AF3|nr:MULTISPECIES: tRNA pseudouridine(38-40) synthase TruA [unclassified Treponema]UTC66054.1 tRNA pseudouridine(38-40) synthase TruA [Treponema sp. OMZ 789]UTC68784.1 tRNA pseudouridine(38-40) synthase TruA [Treponema sp. OMZ 790]UTC71513.1 tRNA pseudouridine(38-40) synthase TruA [Treponema sp. OMZ 791]